MNLTRELFCLAKNMSANRGQLNLSLGWALKVFSHSGKEYINFFIFFFFAHSGLLG